MISYMLLCSISGLGLITLAYYILEPKKAFADIPGPSATSWLYGNMLDLVLNAPYGQHEFKWQRQYGQVYRIKGCIGKDRLMVSDPTTVRYILADNGDFTKSAEHQVIHKHVFGRGSVLYAHGADHRRLKSIMLPAFSMTSLRAMVPKLQTVAEELREKWAASLETNLEQGGIIDIFPDMHETTLKAVTRCILGYDMADDKAYAQSYRNLVIAGAKRSKIAILTHSVLLALPDWVMTALTYFPPRGLATLLRFREISDRRSSVFLKGKIEARMLGIEPDNETNLFDIMLNTHQKTPEALTLDEIQNQFGTITVAGEDTTANTLIWAFYELSCNPEWQVRLRREVDAAHDVSTERTPEFYDRIPFLNAMIKEVVRFYSGVPFTERIASRDTVIPVSKPVVSRLGKKVSEIPVRKGQYVEVAISSYNRLQEIWGDDAEIFNPFRWLDNRNTNHAEGALGPYANVLTFIGGPRTCIGWRFAVLEMQVVLCDVIKHVHIDNLDPAATHPVHAISLVPLRREENGRIGMPLKVRFI